MNQLPKKQHKEIKWQKRFKRHVSKSKKCNFGPLWYNISNTIDNTASGLKLYYTVKNLKTRNL